MELTIAAETNAMSVQRSLVLGGHGLTILPPIAVADDLARKRVSAAPLCDPPIMRTIVLALPANRVVGQHVRRAVDLLVQCAKDAVDTEELGRKGAGTGNVRGLDMTSLLSPSPPT